MKLSILGAALMAMGCCVALAAPAVAQTAAQPAPSSQSATAHAASQGQAPAAAAKHEDPRYGTRMCVRDTGSLLKAPKGQCLPVNGNTYSRKDLWRTGHVNLGRALQDLDPSVTVGH